MSEVDGSEPRRYEGDLFTTRPGESDIGVAKLMVRYLILIVPAIVAFDALLMQYNHTTPYARLIAGVGAVTLLILGFVAFGGDFFDWRMATGGRWRREVPVLHQIEYFAWQEFPQTFATRSANGRRLVLSQSLRVVALPTTIHGNFKTFLRQLHGARVPFSFQVTHAPTSGLESAMTWSLGSEVRGRDWRRFEPQEIPTEAILPNDSRMGEERAWRTSILLTTWVQLRGYLLFPPEVHRACKELDGQMTALRGAFSSNYPHAKATPVTGREMAAAAQGLFSGPVWAASRRFIPRVVFADILKLTTILVGGVTFAAWMKLLPLSWWSCGIVWSLFGVLAACAMPNLFPAAIGVGAATYFQPYAGRRFYALRRAGRTARGVVSVIEGSKRITFAGAVTVGHVALEAYADPNKLLRAALAEKLPLLYQWMAVPLDYRHFYRIAKSCFRTPRQKDDAGRIPPDDQVRVMSLWGGFWSATGIVGTCAYLDVGDETREELAEGRKLGSRQLRELIALLQNNFRDVGLVRLRGILLRGGLSAMATRSLGTHEPGAGFCGHVIAGGAFAPYVEVLGELKKGLETCIPAEFNTPTNLDNYVVLGNTLNTEFLEQETPAGLSRQCLAAPVGVLGGTPHERAAVMQRIAVELLARGEGGIALDHAGTWTGLPAIVSGTSTYIAGKDFWADPFTIMKAVPGFADAFGDMVAKVHAWRTLERNTLLAAVQQTNEGRLELVEVRKAVELLLPERAALTSDALRAFMDELTFGRSALFFRTGLVNLPVETWVASRSLVILDFSPLPEPQQVIARMVVYLYMVFLARAGKVSTRTYIDEMERVCREVRETAINEESFAQTFAIGALPVVAGVGRVSLVHPSYLELFDAAVCLQVKNKKDLRVAADIMGMGDEAEGGLFSSRRKSSYQLEFLQQLRAGWAVVKRSDRPEPFPMVLNTFTFKHLAPAPPASATAGTLIQSRGSADPGLALIDLSLPAEATLIEHDLGPLAGFAAEALDFLLAVTSAQQLNGGPLSHKLLTDQLLYKLQPALFRFRVAEHPAKDLRDRLLNALTAADYLRATYRKDPNGLETGLTTYEVTPKLHEAIADARVHAGAALREQLEKMEGKLPGIVFAGKNWSAPELPTPESMPSPPPRPFLPPSIFSACIPGSLDAAFARVFLPGLASARVAYMNEQPAEAATKAGSAFACFLAQALGREASDLVAFDGLTLARALAKFPEWPFDADETQVLWDEFRQGQWVNLDATEVGRKLHELTAFQEDYQLRTPAAPIISSRCPPSS